MTSRKAKIGISIILSIFTLIAIVTGIGFHYSQGVVESSTFKLLCESSRTSIRSFHEGFNEQLSACNFMSFFLLPQRPPVRIRGFFGFKDDLSTGECRDFEDKCLNCFDTDLKSKYCSECGSFQDGHKYGLLFQVREREYFCEIEVADSRNP